MQPNSTSDIEQAFGTAERIGVLGSPSSTAELNVDILGAATDKRLVGNLGVFRFTQDNDPHYALGQITEIQMKNVWTEDQTMRGIIREKGQVDPITENQDTHLAKMDVSSVLAETDDGLEQSDLGTVPPTGTAIRLVNAKLMQALFAQYSDELFYLGEAYGTEIPLPMWFKHFGEGKGGKGEAYHIGIFGKTGSGKSVTAQMMLLGYARHTDMSLFILDPQGEFTETFQSNPEIKNILFSELGREADFHNLHDIVLTGDELFRQILTESKFFDKLGIYNASNKIRAADAIIQLLDCPPYEYYQKENFGKFWKRLNDPDFVSRIYTSEEPQERVIRARNNADIDEFYDHWKGIANLFSYDRPSGTIKIKNLAKKIGSESGSLVLVDLSETNVPEDIYWNDEMRLVTIGEILERVADEAEQRYKENELLNCIVLLDEAHRLAPSGTPDAEPLERVKEELIDAVRTTRKYGLGWTFVSQTLSSIDKEILQQIRIYFFGFGLALGAEQRALRSIVGGADEALGLYKQFKDPQSSLGEPEFPFMAYGPVSPLSFSGSPLFFNAFQFPDEFTSQNFDK